MFIRKVLSVFLDVFLKTIFDYRVEKIVLKIVILPKDLFSVKLGAASED
jgi:hypothetical protein